MASGHAPSELPLASDLRMGRYARDSDAEQDTCRKRQRFSDKPMTCHFLSMPSVLAAPVTLTTDA
jgi:hypothetical protein